MIKLPLSRFQLFLILVAGLTVLWIIMATAGMTSHGVLGYEADSENRIVAFSPGGPAGNSGLQVGDKINNIEGKNGRLQAGQTVTLVVVREEETLRFNMTAIPRPVAYRMFRLASGIMALGFLFCGLVAFLMTGSRPSIIFLLYGICRAIHDSGQPNTSSTEMQNLILSMVLLAMMLSASLFLHFTLIFPKRWTKPLRKSTWVWFYMPVVLAFLLAAVRAVLPSTNPTAVSLTSVFYYVALIPAYLYTLLAVLVIVIRFFRASAIDRQTFGLDIMLWGTALAFLPYFVVMVIEAQLPSITIPGGQGSHLFTLFFIILPLTFTYSILKNHQLLKGKGV